ncbi:MAG: hypothetical protein JST70_04840 [Bacteroidetes bacterium]|nr:hypothetical protein [Bacteroidota bacterium]
MKEATAKQIALLEEQLEEVELQVLEATRRLKELKRQLAILRKSSFDWAEISLKCLAQFDEPLSTTEILDMFIYLKNEEISSIKRREYIMALSLRLNRMVQAGRLFKHNHDGIKGNFYGLKEWQEGEILKPLYASRLKEKVDSIKPRNEDNFLTKKRTRSKVVLQK